MSNLITAATLVAKFQSRNPAPGVLESVSAADASKLKSVEAAALRPFSTAGKLKIIKATEHFFVAGEIVPAGDFVEVPENDALRIISMGRAVEATDAEVAKAQKAEA